MSAHIALLRAVNVGGRKPVIMAELRHLLTEIGFSDVHSILQTGNLVFRGSARRIEDDLEGFLEKEAAKAPRSSHRLLCSPSGGVEADHR